MIWPHAPAHYLGEQGAYIVTAGTYMREQFFQGKERLSMLQGKLLGLADQYGWHLQAWAVFSNHYHFVDMSPEGAASLRTLIGHLHTVTASEVNREDNARGRRVSFQYWDTHLTFEKSYLARLNYVHQNAVRHGVVSLATDYPWCSAAWFEKTADPAFFRTVTSFKLDRVNVYDDFVLDCGGLTPL